MPVVTVTVTVTVTVPDRDLGTAALNRWDRPERFRGIMTPYGVRARALVAALTYQD